MGKQRYLDKQDQKNLRIWWAWLDSNRGDRARFRRVSEPDDMLMTPEFSNFLQKMSVDEDGGKREFRMSMTDAAMMAALVARVRKDNYEKNSSFAKALASPAKEGSAKAAMSELRFQQLQKSRTPEEFYRRMCRAIDLLDSRVNIIDMADSVLHWLHEWRTAPAENPQHRLAVKWATQYYSTFKD